MSEIVARDASGLSGEVTITTSPHVPLLMRLEVGNGCEDGMCYLDRDGIRALINACIDWLTQ